MKFLSSQLAYVLGQREMRRNLRALLSYLALLAATIATDEVFAAFWSDAPGAALMHGPTFMANPLGCAAANASLDLFEREPRFEQARAIEAQLSAELEPCRSLVWYAGHALGALPDEASLTACHAKAHLAELSGATHEAAEALSDAIRLSKSDSEIVWLNRKLAALRAH